MPGSARRNRRRGVLTPVLWIPAILALTLFGLPLLALMLRAPWARLPELLSQPAIASALLLSLGTGLVSTLIALVLGVPLALVLAQSAQWPAVPRRLLRALVTVPLVLPPVVGGVALLLLLGRRGLLGQYLPFQLPFTSAAVVIAQVFVAMPFLVLAVEGALRASDRRFEIAAATLGASRFTVFRRITLPLVAPGIAAGALLCFCRALGEFGATITFAGSFPGTTQTLPIATYLQLQTDPDAAIALSLVLMLISVAVLIGLRDRWVPGVTG
ncbi:ABC transporter permease [Salinibacterium sp.]|uniref:ABC transporter permease n=1 Tax=Salinibacterium sp. TaxID=1915057 RepID=UPI00286C2EEF|nr:ABC transporter permease [Salinibacterium sp.]